MIARPQDTAATPASTVPATVAPAPVAVLLSAGTRRLRAAGVEEPRRDARLLLSHTMGGSHPALLDAAESVGAAAAEDYERALQRREAREPVSRILGAREFWGLRFRLSADTLDPRPDTETVVEAAVAAFRGGSPPQRILDLGIGSGCLACALLHEFPTAWGLGIDASPGAVATARGNAAANGVGGRAAFAAGDWGSALEGTFELIVSNPPYVARTEFAALSPEVSTHDPRRALDGGGDGLDQVRTLAPQLARLAAPGARIFVEVGDGQADAAAALLAAAGLRTGPHAVDLAGIARVVTAVAVKGNADFRRKRVGMLPGNG